MERASSFRSVYEFSYNIRRTRYLLLWEATRSIEGTIRELVRDTTE
jgi:hypothetical protein